MPILPTTDVVRSTIMQTGKADSSLNSIRIRLPENLSTSRNLRTWEIMKMCVGVPNQSGKSGGCIYSHRSVIRLRFTIFGPGFDSGFPSLSVATSQRHLVASGCSSDRTGRKQLRSGWSFGSGPGFRQQSQFRIYHSSCR